MRFTYNDLAKAIHHLNPVQRDFPVTACGSDGNLYTVDGSVGIQTQNNGSTVIDPETPIIFLNLVNEAA